MTNKNYSSLLRWGLILLLSIMIVGPLLSLFLRAIIVDGQINFSNAWQVLTDTTQLTTIWNSLLLGFLVVIFTSIISFPVAYLLARTDFSQYKFLNIVFMIPFMTPPYIASMGWILFMQRRGLLQQMFPFAAGSEDWFFSLAGLVIVMSFNNYPFMITMMRDAMMNVPSSLEESASIFGAGFWQRLTKIILPLLKGNFAIAALLIFVRTISEYGAPATLGPRFGFEVFTTAIHRNATVAPINFGTSATLSVVLIIICFIFWFTQTKITEKATYNLVGSRNNRMNVVKLSGSARFFGWLYIIILLLLSIGVPYFAVIATSFIHRRGRGLQAGNFTFQHYIDLFTQNDRAVNAISNSFLLAAASATICVILGVIIVTVIRKRRSVLDRPLEFISLIPEMLPGIVIVLGLMIFWNTFYQVLPIYNTMAMLLLAYTVLFLPYTINYVNSAYNQISDNIMEAAQIYGASPWFTFRRVSLPLLSQAILTSWMMSFIIGLRELVASSMISPPGEYVISTFIQREFEQGSVSVGMAMATITVLLTTISLIILNTIIAKSRR